MVYPELLTPETEGHGCQISSSYNINFECLNDEFWMWALVSTVIQSRFFIETKFKIRNGCESRTRTYKRRLANQCWILNQEQELVHLESIIDGLYRNSPPLRQRGMAAKFHHLTILILNVWMWALVSAVIQSRLFIGTNFKIELDYQSHKTFL
jgi:hypothetical protein